MKCFSDQELLNPLLIFTRQKFGFFFMRLNSALTSFLRDFELGDLPHNKLSDPVLLQKSPSENNKKTIRKLERSSYFKLLINVKQFLFLIYHSLPLSGCHCDTLLTLQDSLQTKGGNGESSRTWLTIQFELILGFLLLLLSLCGMRIRQRHGANLRPIVGLAIVGLMKGAFKSLFFLIELFCVCFSTSPFSLQSCTRQSVGMKLLSAILHSSDEQY